MTSPTSLFSLSILKSFSIFVNIMEVQSHILVKVDFED